ncbi:MAG TPA: radical SAM protein [Egibacteraceae bacterium]|nr:radical SAM protein [Egibacteraceae bacterium]
MRVLLVHANPYQQIFPVPAYGLERISTAVAERDDVTVELIDPFLESTEPIGYTAEAVRRIQPDLIGFGIRITEDLIPVADVDGAGPHDVVWLLPDIARVVQAAVEAAPQAVAVCGGAGFSAMPYECLDYLGIDLGVVGAGEQTFARLVDRLAAGQDPGVIPGLIRRDDPGPRIPGRAYQMGRGGPTRRDGRYAPCHDFPIRTRIGCAMVCSYCVIASLERAHQPAEVDVVLDEVAAAVAATKSRGIGPTPLFFSDDEFNLPDEAHAIAILEGIVARGLASHLIWNGYFHPQPFSDELARLVKATNGRPQITADSAADAVLARNHKPHRRKTLDAVVDTLARNHLDAEIVFMFGLPGETHETVAETVEFIKALPAGIRASWAAGARVFPHTPLAGLADEHPEYVVGEADPTRFRPTVYSSPVPPRELARNVTAALEGQRHVQRYGAPFGERVSAAVEAYRLVADGADRPTWAALLTKAQEPHGILEPSDQLQAVQYVAAWQRRFDLASLACKAAARHAPRGRRARLRAQGLVYTALDKLPAGAGD